MGNFGTPQTQYEIAVFVGYSGHASFVYPALPSSYGVARASRGSFLRNQPQKKTAIIMPQMMLPHSYGAIGASISNFFDVSC